MDLIDEIKHAETINALKSLRKDIGSLTKEVGSVKAVDVQVNHSVDELRGKVAITNDLRADITNIDEVTKKLDSVIKAIEANKTDSLSLTDPVIVKDLDVVSKLLEKLLEKDTTVNVASPNVKVSSPDKINIANWPTKASEPLSVRLSNGKEFIEQLQRAAGGGGVVPFRNDSGDPAYPVLVNGKVPVDATVTATFTGGTFTAADANNTFGSAVALANGATATLVNIPSTATGYKITGISCTGNGDGYFFVTVAGSTILSGRTRFSQPSVVINLPNPIPITAASAVALKVTNESGSTADFEATLTGA